jgi:hypothetical protein
VKRFHCRVKGSLDTEEILCRQKQMSLLVNTLADAIKSKDVEKFNAFLDRACIATGSDTANNVAILNNLKELLSKATTHVNAKIQKAVNEKALAEMRQASECIIVGDTSSQASSSIDLTQSEKSPSSSSSSSDGVAIVGMSQATRPDTVIDNAQFLEPRGRFNVSITNSGLLLQGKQSLFAPWTKITHIARVPSHSSTKKEGEDVLAIKLSTENCVEMNGKPVKHLVWVVGNSINPTGETESNMVSEAIQALWKKRIGGINKSVFQTALNQKAFLRCYNGLQEGGLYPLKCGVVFIKPLVFVPIEEIASVAAGRGGGTGNTRYVDLHVSWQICLSQNNK